MKLAEALVLRGDYQKRLEQLKFRLIRRQPSTVTGALRTIHGYRVLVCCLGEGG